MNIVITNRGTNNLKLEKNSESKHSSSYLDDVIQQKDSFNKKLNLKKTKLFFFILEVKSQRK